MSRVQIFLARQANIVTQGEQPLEQLDCLLVPAAQLIPAQETVLYEIPLQHLHGRDHSRVIRGQESHVADCMSPTMA
jgi:hypothetical protein